MFSILLLPSFAQAALMKCEQKDKMDLTLDVSDELIEVTFNGTGFIDIVRLPVKVHTSSIIAGQIDRNKGELSVAISRADGKVKIAGRKEKGKGDWDDTSFNCRVVTAVL